MKCCGFDEKDKSPKQAFSERIDAIGWALFFIMIAILLLLPDETVPETAWLIGAGLIMLGGNVARRLFGIKMEACTLILGSIAILFGIAGFAGVEIPVFPILLIIIGASIILGPLFKKKKK